MKYVVDSSIALKVVLPEVDSGKAVRLLEDYLNAVHALIAPDFFTSEVANGLVAAERLKRIKAGEAGILLHDILANAPVFHPSNHILIRAMDIALGSRQAVYDCIYLALAEVEGCEFLTADDNFARRLRPTYPFIASLSPLP